MEKSDECEEITDLIAMSQMTEGSYEENKDYDVHGFSGTRYGWLFRKE